ncbi:chaperone modulator CbpM [Maribacter sp. MAR_2009_72]|uniref:chaperone modulator CbpM n=1 Tax=Maribacter sp. MAR_2009_72 TaxID=1250050 RepID=UPI00119BCF24|nr:chaperone modulator CbpM [Maribacter sp. MAR_2009_72]TVZ14150.1 MerR-like DNA binding protein [Maribacter sp. MAR_2009_72]
MDTSRYIQIEVYCERTQTPLEFIEDLLEFEMIEIEHIEHKKYIQTQQIVEIERIHRLRNDLGINLEGIATLNNMLQKINSLEKEVKLLQDRLMIYET